MASFEFGCQVKRPENPEKKRRKKSLAVDRSTPTCEDRVPVVLLDGILGQGKVLEMQCVWRAGPNIIKNHTRAHNESKRYHIFEKKHPIERPAKHIKKPIIPTSPTSPVYFPPRFAQASEDMLYFRSQKRTSPDYKISAPRTCSPSHSASPSQHSPILEK